MFKVVINLQEGIIRRNKAEGLDEFCLFLERKEREISRVSKEGSDYVTLFLFDQFVCNEKQIWGPFDAVCENEIFGFDEVMKLKLVEKMKRFGGKGLPLYKFSEHQVPIFTGNFHAGFGGTFFFSQEWSWNE